MAVNQSSCVCLRKNTYYFSGRVSLGMKVLYSGSCLVKSLRARSSRVTLRGSHQTNVQL
jgi:hypothetical protein